MGSIIDETINKVKGVAGSKIDQVSEQAELLHTNKYRGEHLRFPLNIEGPDEDHWIRFSMNKVRGYSIGETGDAPALSSGSGISREKGLLGEFKTGVKSLIGDVVSAPVNAINSTVNTFTNSLPPALGKVAKAFANPSNTTEKSVELGSVMLFMPVSNEETVSPSYTAENLGAVGGVVGAAIAGLKRGTGPSDTELASLKRTAVAGFALEAVKNAASLVGAEAVVKTVPRSLGIARNPHLESFFDGMPFRTYTWTFTLAPRNKPEAVEIQKIVRALKHASVPEFLQGIHGYFYAYPYMFDIATSNENQTHKIGRSVLTNLTVNHGGEGQNRTFYDDYPVETVISMSFQEVEVLHKAKVLQGY